MICAERLYPQSAHPVQGEEGSEPTVGLIMTVSGWRGGSDLSSGPNSHTRPLTALLRFQLQGNLSPSSGLNGGFTHRHTLHRDNRIHTALKKRIDL